MNELLAFEQYVAEHLDDRLAARALIDFREDALGISHKVAVRAVAAIRKQARDARELAEAAALLAKGSPSRRAISNLIRSAGSEPWRGFGTIVLVAGSRYPTFYPARTWRGKVSATRGIIEVGARRVLWIAQAIS